MLDLGIGCLRNFQKSVYPAIAWSECAHLCDVTAERTSLKGLPDMITFREDAKYALLVPTSMGVRLTPAGGQRVHCSTTFSMQVTSAESNVASVSSYLGLPVKVLTAFVKGSPIARMIKDDLAGRHIDYEGPEVDQGGPWGYRHQFNMADTGYGSRGPRVHNDRAGEVGRTLNAKDFDLDRIFGREGVQIVHLSGLVAALSPETSCLLPGYRAGRQKGTAAASRSISTTAPRSGRVAKTSSPGLPRDRGPVRHPGRQRGRFPALPRHRGPGSRGQGPRREDRELQGHDRAGQGGLPRDSGLCHHPARGRQHQCPSCGAQLRGGRRWHVVEPREIGVLDRIGGGDGFVGGMLYAILRGWEPEKWIQFGWASGALVTTLLTDYAQPADEEQIWSIWEGNARVRR